MYSKVKCHFLTGMAKEVCTKYKPAFAKTSSLASLFLVMVGGHVGRRIIIRCSRDHHSSRNGGCNCGGSGNSSHFYTRDGSGPRLNTR